MTATPAPAQRVRVPAVILAFVPASVVLAATLFVSTFAGRYQLLGPAYGPLLNAGVLLRAFGVFASVLLVWGALRSRGASRGLLTVAILSGPIMYGLTAAIAVLDYFPPGEAAYYAVNPIFIASVFGQCATAAIAEALWRWWSRRRGRDARRPLTWRITAVIVGGLAVVFFTVVFQGGVVFFYVYQRGYEWLFT